VVGYVGYALKEPWGQPRAVIGFSADEAERLAEFLEHDNADAQQPLHSPAYSVPQPMLKSSGTGPQPTFTPQPKFTPQAAPPAVQPLAQPVAQPSAPPAVPPPAAHRQSGQRSQSRHARGSQPKPRAATSETGNRAKQAPDPAEEPGMAAQAAQESLHAASVPEQTSLVDVAADRS
jgi:hypothetical protein